MKFICSVLVAALFTLAQSVVAEIPKEGHVNPSENNPWKLPPTQCVQLQSGFEVSPL